MDAKSVVVAAVDTESTGPFDYVCDGVDDNVTIETAMTRGRTPIPDAHGEPMQNYPLVKQGVFEGGRTTLNPGRYLVWRIEEVDE